MNNYLFQLIPCNPMCKVIVHPYILDLAYFKERKLMTPIFALGQTTLRKIGSNSLGRRSASNVIILLVFLSVVNAQSPPSEKVEGIS